MKQAGLFQASEQQNWLNLLRQRVEEHPDQIAQTFLSNGEDCEVNLTFAELDLRARAIGAAMQQHIAEGERVLLLFSPGIEFICGFMGCLYAKMIAVPVYPPRRGQMDSRLSSIVLDAQPALILTSDKIRNDLQKAYAEMLKAAGIQVLASDKLPMELAYEWQAPLVHAETLAFLQYTSGSTGSPKGVMVSHGNLLHNANLIQSGFQHPIDATSVFWLPEYHDMGLIGGILQPLILGIRSIRMSPVDFLQKPVRWLQAISTYRAATSGAPNFAYDLCSSRITPEQRATLDLSSWTLAFCGAEPVRSDTLERFAQTFAECGFQRQAFYPCYGMAEATLMISGGMRGSGFRTIELVDAALTEHVVVPLSEQSTPAVTEKSTMAENTRAVRTIVSCGAIAGEQEVLVVDPYSQQICAASHVGEIWVYGESVAKGYWNKVALTREIFQAKLAEDTGKSYLRTGDLGFIHKGELYITGRLKDVIIIRGRNHYPQDIELSVEQSHPALRPGYGAAFSVEIADEERLVIAFEVDRHHVNALNIEDVTATIRRTVAEQHGLQTAAILLLRTTTIPKTSSGKIQRYACRNGFAKNSLDVVGEWRAPNLN